MADGPVDPYDTRCEMTWIVMPGLTNSLGTVFGGQVMAWIDVCAAVSAQRLSRCAVVTAAMDDLSFKAPIKNGDVVVIQSMVNWAGRSSMEVGVRVEKECRETGERTHTSSAYLTFVALDEDGGKHMLPELVPTTPETRHRHADALVRREMRLAARELRRARREES